VGVRSQTYSRNPRSPVPMAYIKVANGEVTEARRETSNVKRGHIAAGAGKIPLVKKK